MDKADVIRLVCQFLENLQIIVK